MYIIVAVYAKKQFYWKYIDFCCTEKKTEISSNYCVWHWKQLWNWQWRSVL